MFLLLLRCLDDVHLCCPAGNQENHWIGEKTNRSTPHLPADPMKTTDANHWSRGGHVTARRTDEDENIATRHTGSGAIQNVPLASWTGDNTATNRRTVVTGAITADRIRGIPRNPNPIRRAVDQWTNDDRSDWWAGTAGGRMSSKT